MNRLVEDLVDAARTARGHVGLRPEPTDLRTVVTEVLDAARPLVTEKGHEVSLAAPVDSVNTLIDKARIQQVLMNVLTNAAKYTDEGGRITVTVEGIDGKAIVTVQDNGRGIEAAMLPRVFDLFVRRGTATGFGVGLAVARRLVELHGGTMQAMSDGPGTGTKVTVQLPAR